MFRERFEDYENYELFSMFLDQFWLLEWKSDSLEQGLVVSVFFFFFWLPIGTESK